MTPAQARSLAAGLIAAADKAEAEGRDLLETDLDVFAAADDAARAELQAAIARAGGITFPAPGGGWGTAFLPSGEQLKIGEN